MRHCVVFDPLLSRPSDIVRTEKSSPCDGEFDHRARVRSQQPLPRLKEVPGSWRVTVGGDKGFDTAEFVAECRNLHLTPQVAQNQGRRGGSAIDAHTTRPAGCRISQKKRKRIEECFGWLERTALLRKLRHRGTLQVDWIFAFACAAYNLVRMRNLLAATVATG
jgi:Transposase DDE domain